MDVERCQGNNAATGNDAGSAASACSTLVIMQPAHEHGDLGSKVLPIQYQHSASADKSAYSRLQDCMTNLPQPDLLC